MGNKVFGEEFQKFAKEHNLSEEELLKYIFAFSERKKVDWIEERREKRRKRIACLNNRRKMLLSDLDVSMMTLDQMKKPISR